MSGPCCRVVSRGPDVATASETTQSAKNHTSAASYASPATTAGSMSTACRWIPNIGLEWMNMVEPYANSLGCS